MGGLISSNNRLYFLKAVHVRIPIRTAIFCEIVLGPSSSLILSGNHAKAIRHAQFVRYSKLNILHTPVTTVRMITIQHLHSLFCKNPFSSIAIGVGPSPTHAPAVAYAVYFHNGHRPAHSLLCCGLGVAPVELSVTQGSAQGFHEHGPTQVLRHTIIPAVKLSPQI